MSNTMSVTEKLDRMWDTRHEAESAYEAAPSSSSWTDFTALTPPPTEPATTTVADTHDENIKHSNDSNNDSNNDSSNQCSRSRSAVPWPNSTFQIFEKHSNRAIAVVDGQVALKPVNRSSSSSRSTHDEASTHWLCKEKNEYRGFYNEQSGTFLGHDGWHGIIAQATALDCWELADSRPHPEGGYQILFPFYWHTLKVLCVAEDGWGLVRRDHGTTLWEFVRVDDRD